jgi:hypothetical protein
MFVIVQLVNDLLGVDDLHGAESPDKLLVIKGAETGLIQSLIENSSFVTEVHVAHLVAA